MCEQAIALVDADCFYVSAERQRHPELVGKPVAVLGNHSVCVIARSYEMREYGVKTGMAIWEAKRLCPEGIYIKADFRYYGDVSRSILETLRRMFPAVEYYSVDECFAEVRPEKGQGFAELATAIRDSLLERIGVPLSVGIGSTKTLAKMICSSSKPFGARAIVDRESELNFLVTQPVAAIPGIGVRRQALLRARGVETAYQFGRMERVAVRRLLKLAGEAVWMELRGEHVYGIRVKEKRPKSFSRGGSFGSPTDNPWIIYAFLERNVERLSEKLEEHGLVAGRIEVITGTRNGTFNARATVPAQTALTEMLLSCARPCLRDCWDRCHEVRRMWVTVDELSPRTAAQRSLFDPSDTGMLARAALKRLAREKFGRDSLRSGISLFLPDSALDPQQSFQLSDIPGKTVF